MLNMDDVMIHVGFVGYGSMGGALKMFHESFGRSLLENA